VKFSKPAFTIQKKRKELDLPTYLGQLHFEYVAVLNPRIIVSNLFGGWFDFQNYFDIGKHNHCSWEQEAKEKNTQNKSLSSHWSLCQPPVQSAGGPERLRGIAPNTSKRHRSPEHSVGPDYRQTDKCMMSLKPGTWKIIQELQLQIHMYLAQLNMSFYTRSRSLLGCLTAAAVGFILPPSRYRYWPLS